MLVAWTVAAVGQAGVLATGVPSRHTERMRETFAHDAVLMMDPGADTAAPGAAITTALCGHWEHQPPCPLAPHHTEAARRGEEVHLRILFATEPEREPDVRLRIEKALTAQWRVRSCTPSTVRPGEANHAARLVLT